MKLEVVPRGSGRPSLVRRGIVSVSPNYMIRLSRIDMMAVNIDLNGRCVILSDPVNKIIGLEAPGTDSWRIDQSRAIHVKGPGLPGIRARNVLVVIDENINHLKGYYRVTISGATLVIDLSKKLAGWTAHSIDIRGGKQEIE